MRTNRTLLWRCTRAALSFSIVALVGVPLVAQAAGEHGASYGHPGGESEVDRKIVVKARDIDFGHDKIQVEPGETVRFVVKNTGNLRHEFTIGPPSVQKQHRREMTEMMESGELKTGTRDHARGKNADASGHGHANSVMVAPGESMELIWHFEKVQGVMFACNVPGHYQAGMKGEFIPRG